MTTSNLTVAGTATLPSASSSTLGGVMVQSGSGLLVDGSGDLSVDSTQYLAVSTASSTYAPKSAPTFSGTVNSTGPIRVTNSGVGPAALIKIDGQYINFAINGNAGGGIVFPDGTFQGSGVQSTNILNLTDWTSNSQMLIWTAAVSNTITMGPDNNCEIVHLSTYPGTLNLVFPTPAHDGQFFELVIIGGSGGYALSGLGIDGVTAVTIMSNIGSTAYETGSFRYNSGANTWFQVS